MGSVSSEKDVVWLQGRGNRWSFAPKGEGPSVSTKLELNHRLSSTIQVESSS